MGEFLRHEEVEDRDAFMHRVLFFPRGRFHFREARAHDDLHVLAAETAGGAAAVHRGVAAAEHDHALADLGDVAERDAGEPVDADMDVGGGLLAAADLEIAPARRARADEHGIPVFRQELLEAVDALAAAELDADVEDVIALLVDHRLGQAKFLDLRAHHAARLGILVEHDAGVTHGCEVARDGERRRAAAHQRDALGLFVRWTPGQAPADVVLEIGGDALQAADPDPLLFQPARSAARHARPIPRPAPDAPRP